MSRQVRMFIIGLFLLSGLTWGKQIVSIGEPVALTASGKIYMAPNWSPNGSQIAVSGVKYSGIQIIDFPSGKISTLTEAVGAGYGLAWAPDGEALVARVSQYDNNKRQSQIVLLNLDGTQRELSKKQSFISGVPVWSSSGEYVYLKSGKTFHTYSKDPTRMNTLSGRLVYLHGLSVYQRDLDTKTESILSDPEQRVLHLAISPNQKQFVYSTVGEHLWIADMDGSNRRELGRGTAPSWSPDGKQVACMVTRDDGHVFTSADILIHDISDKTLTKLTNTPDIHEMNPAWSPDGKWIAYDNERDGRIWVIQVEGR